MLLPHSFLLNGNSFMLTNGCDFSFVLFLFGFLFFFCDVLDNSLSVVLRQLGFPFFFLFFF